MKWQVSLIAYVLLGSAGLAQESFRGTPDAPVAAPVPPAMVEPVLDESPPAWNSFAQDRPGGLPTGNRNFPNFIGPISNPVQAIDPRALTQLYPIFGSSWVSAFPPLSEGDIQLYGAGLTVALSERLSVGLNQGGYAVSHFERRRLLPRNTDPSFRDKDREGWLNLGGFVQYTLIQDVPNQFLLTSGLRLEVPTGEADVFQGHGPAYLAPYFTVGKEFGEFHVLSTIGYQFPTGPGRDVVNTFYGTLHLDRRLFGWLYPLVEFNWAYHVNQIDLTLPSRRGFFNPDNFDATGNLITVAVGANAILIQDRLELGAVYTTPIATQRDFDFDGLLVKMILRY